MSDLMLQILPLLTILFLATVLLFLIYLMLRLTEKQRETSLSQNQMTEKISSEQSQVMLAAMTLLSQATNLIASQDALTYQALQVTTNPLVSSHSEEEEEFVVSDADFELLMERNARGEVLTEDERERLIRGAVGI